MSPGRGYPNEGLAVSTAVRRGLLFFCLGLAGCGLFGKKPATKDSAAGRPFLGTNPPASAAQTASNPPAGINGVLAGQVMDRFNRRQPGVFIQVVDLNTAQQPSPAKIEVAADGQGYFTIQGLQPGKHYQLIARTKEGDKVLTGTTLAQPPNPRLSIYISDDLASPSTPPAPPPPALPGKAAPEKDDKPASIPSASLNRPALDRPAEIGSTPPIHAAPASVMPQPAPPATDPSRVVELGGFARVPSAPTVSVPSAADVAVIPRPPTTPFSSVEPYTAPIIPSGPTTQLPGAAPPVPYCVLVGRKLDNFALYGLDSQPWEFRRDHKGRLVLLDFWYSSCGPCLQAIPHLVELQRQYGSFGLEVVGIAYEKGKPADQVQKVRAVRGRYGIPPAYQTLLGGGGQGTCPVRTQFEINAFPTLVLLDGTGQILWRSEGLDANMRLGAGNRDPPPPRYPRQVKPGRPSLALSPHCPSRLNPLHFPVGCPARTAEEVMGLRTPLYEKHLALGARMVDFAGWDMPVQYTGIVEEHAAVRSAAGLFDISHMGRLSFAGPDALALIQQVYTNNAATLADGQARYGLVCNEKGGIRDDVLVYRWPYGYAMVVNATNREKLVAWLDQHRAGRDVQVEDQTLRLGHARRARPAGRCPLPRPDRSRPGRLALLSRRPDALPGQPLRPEPDRLHRARTESRSWSVRRRR